jgi:hypothetical protein
MYCMDISFQIDALFRHGGYADMNTPGWCVERSGAVVVAYVHCEPVEAT